MSTCSKSPVNASTRMEAPHNIVNALHHELPEPLEHPPLHLAVRCQDVQLLVGIEFYIAKTPSRHVK